MAQEPSCHLPVLVPPRVAACTVVGALTKLILHLSIPTVVWLLCIGFLMPGKRSYVNAVSGCLTPDQLRRQARDRVFLPQPPPPPLSEAPRYSAWEDIVDKCDCATQCCDPTFPAAQVEPPLSGSYLETINRAFGIIELQSRLLAAPLPPRPISLDAFCPLPSVPWKRSLLLPRLFRQHRNW